MIDSQITHKIDILQPADLTPEERNKESRRKIKNIIDSYSGVNDILIELAQNSVDAIDSNERYQRGEIKLGYDLKRHRISIRDNGCGINYKDLRIFAPDVSLKDGKKSRGEKGVGLTFLVFSTNELEFETDNGTERIFGTIQDANNWLCGRVTESPNMIIKERGPSTGQTYTEFALNNICFNELDDTHIFQYMDPNDLIRVLRTKTAIGNTTKLWENSAPEKDIDIKLVFTNAKDEVTEFNVPYEFDCLRNQKYRCISIEERKRDLLQENQNHNFGVPTYVIRHYERNGQKIRIYMLAASNNLQHGFFKKVLGETGKQHFEIGIFTAHRKMPTPVKIGWHPKQLYQGNLYSLVEMDDFDFDIGRKSLNMRNFKTLKECLNNAYNELDKYMSKITGSDSTDEQTEVRTEEDNANIGLMWDAINERLDLPMELKGYKKVPAEEQDVVALFNQLIAMGYIKMVIYGSFSNKQYDCFVKVGIPNSDKISKKIVEFKLHASDLINEIVPAETSIKTFQHINFLVCWTLGEEKRFVEKGLHIVPVENFFYEGVTHKLSNNSGGLIYVICLHDFIKKIEQERKIL